MTQTKTKTPLPSGWSVSTDLGAVYAVHTASLDMMIFDKDLDIIEDDLSGRSLPKAVEAEVVRQAKLISQTENIV